jgi:CRISPR type I-E/ECOLI-associated protein CasA/Cse1
MSDRAGSREKHFGQEKQPSYSLIDEPWLPVRLASGEVRSISLLEAFERSDDIVALAETAPPSLVAQYRLLLAITHRALTTQHGRWKEADRARWYEEGLPLAAIRAYLEEWRERFWLFHAEYPFMQAAVLDSSDKTRDKQKPWTQISLASTSGNAPVVFDHAYDTQPEEITPAQAVNTLLGFLQFTPGGLVKVFRDSDKAGALANTAAAIPVGKNLAQTLVLCLHDAENKEVADRPSWERAPLTESQLSGGPVFATGPNDRYTRQSRAVLLLREDNGNIRWLRFGAGLALGDGENQPDPMASYRAGSNGLVRISFSEGRAAWRDLPSLVPGPRGEDENRRPAAVINYAASLHRALPGRAGGYQPMLIAGLASDKAKLLRWRLDQIALPANLLNDAQRARLLKEFVADSEALFYAVRGLALSMVTESLPDPGSPDTRKKAQGLLKAGPFATTYFAVAERALPDLMRRLGEGDFDAADTQWKYVLREAAYNAWHNVTTGLGSTPRALRAEARYIGRLNGLLKQHAPKEDNVDASSQGAVS